MSASPPTDAPIRPYEIAIVGNDMLLAALPGRAVQLAHAIQACGYDLVVPVSWGEELLADHALRRLEQPGPAPRVFCACPRVRARLTAAGTEITPYLLETVAPPAAAARYLRALEADAPIRITYLGSCEGARDPSIDIRVPPADFLRHLDALGISVVRQPSVFESTIPPDRRRHWSLPGGVPSADALEAGGGYRLLVLESHELVAEVAQHIIAGDRVLIDPGPAVGCSCAGAYEVHRGVAARGVLAALEPPRSPLPVIDVDRRVTLDFPPRVGPPVVPGTDRPESEAPPGVEGIRSIQEAARLKAERRRFAVTPAGIGATGGPRTTEPPPPRGDREPPVREVLTPPIVTAPVPPHDEAETPEEPAEVPALPAPLPGEVHPEISPEPATEAGSGAARTEESAPSPAEPPVSGAGRPRRRTPVYEMRQAARSIAHLRHAARGEVGVPPRSYGSVRPRVRREAAPTPVPPAPEAPVTVRAAPETVEPAAERPVSQESAAAPSDLHRAAQAALRTRRTAGPDRRVQGERRLWGLLATAVLIAAIALLLFVIFGL